MNTRNVTIVAISAALVLSAGLLLQYNSLAISSSDVNEVKSEDIAVKNGKEMLNARGDHEVWAGWGGPIYTRMAFLPKTMEINAGETVTWINHSVVSEPHTVTFIRDPAHAPELFSAFDVADAKFLPLPPNANSEPMIFPNENGGSILVADNKRVFSPVVIDSEGKVAYLGADDEYTVAGNEKYMNSGWLFPEADNVPGSGGSSFTVTFEKRGSYAYLCIIHPWMSGIITVK